jgi:hypothetical protein
MTIEKIRDLLHASPFVPFSLRLADGREIFVEHPDFVSSSKTGRILNVFYGESEASTLVDVLLVTAVELKPQGNSTAA